MSDIDVLRESRETLSKNSVLSLVADVLLKRIEDITNYNTSSTYYRDDLVYRFNDENGMHEILECRKDGVTGSFNKADWKDMTFNLSTTANKNKDDQLIDIAFDRQICTITAGREWVPINYSNFDKGNTCIMVFHSVKGLVCRSEYTIIDNQKRLYLSSWQLLKDEFLDIIIFQFGKGDGYSKIDGKRYTNVTASTVTSVNIALDGFDNTRDRFFILHSTVGYLLNGTDYTITSTTITLKNSVTLQPNEYLSLVVFAKRYTDGYCNLTHSVYKATADNTTTIPVLVKDFVRGRDLLMVFKNPSEFIPDTLYSTGSDGTMMTLNSSVALRTGEEIHFLCFSALNTNLVQDDSIDLNNLTLQARAMVVPIQGEVVIGVKTPEVIITLPVGRFFSNSYDVSPEVIETTGDVGTISIIEKTNTSFKLKMSGICTRARVQYSIKEGV